MPASPRPGRQEPQKHLGRLPVAATHRKPHTMVHASHALKHRPAPAGSHPHWAPRAAGGVQAAAWDQLKELELKNGQLMLSQMRRVRQLGSGDVGLVDLVELNDGKQMCAAHAGGMPGWQH